MADLFDTRLYRILDGGTNNIGFISPHTKQINAYTTFAYEYYETPDAAAQAPWLKQIENTKISDKEIEEATARSEQLRTVTDSLKNDPDFSAPYSSIHPFALIRLAGGYGNLAGHTIDESGRRKFYEVDGDNAGNYASNPTTTALINWGNQDKRGRFPYAFQDFVFCKYWNKIENNRLITLRRYPTPVVDAVIPGAKPTENFESSKDEATNVYSPVCTAVTYFGEGTDNKLSDILKFTVGYEWEEIKGDIWKIDSQQPEEGGVLGTAGPHWMASGLRHITRALGILGDLSGKSEIIPTDAVGLPPDPYNNGPYENRILGPMNVIEKVMKRNRGLKFSNDGLTITFNYVARPIANINNKAILLDLLSNILLMTSASGTFFGGLRRYRTEKPAVYPWKGQDALNKLYKGQLFGKKSAPASLLRSAWQDEGGFITNFAKELLGDIKSLASDLLAGITGGKIGNEQTDEQKQKTKDDLRAKGSNIGATMGRAVSAHLLKGASIPWINGMKALLTGEPVGEWHLTIGNPLNPIAMIGNLIVDNCEIIFDDELGPDDFPIGFTAKISLKHGMGRDKDAVESMFNRGMGRIYMLSDAYKTAADMETKVDNYTGGTSGRFKVDSFAATATGGRDYVHSFSNPPMENSKDRNEYSKFLSHEMNLLTSSYSFFEAYKLSPWTAHWIL